MYYYAYLNADDICESLYPIPVQVAPTEELIYLGTAPIDVVGQHYNRTYEQFELAYYYAVLDDRSVVVDVEWKLEEQTTSDRYRSITFAQYQTVKGLYWDGSDYVTPPISILAKASTDEVNYKSQDKWLSEKLDEMDAAIVENESGISTLSTALSTAATSLQSVVNSLASLTTTVDGKADAVHGHEVADVTGLSDTLTAIEGEISEVETALAGKANSVHSHEIADVSGLSNILGEHEDDIASLETAMSGKANASHTHAASDLSGVVKTVNGNAPDANGNIVVTNSGMTAEEILAALETADGTGSGLDADLLDGLDASAFALAGHTHARYLTGDDIERFEFVTSDEMTEALDEKSDADHNHDAAYAAITHAHTLSEVAGLIAALAGKSDTSHAHSDYALATDLSNLEEDVEDLAEKVAGKSNISHIHYQSDVVGLTDALNTKANSIHTHSQNAVTGLSEALSGKANASHSHSQNDITGLATALSGKANANHTHNMSDITGLSAALNGKAASNHTHSKYVTFDDVYPVGSVYLSVSSVNPSALFGGTWVMFGSGRTLVGAEVGATAEATGGSATASIGDHSHTTQGHVLTISEMPAHHHELVNLNPSGIRTDWWTNNSVKGEEKVGWTGNVMTSYTGGDSSHSHGDTGFAGAAEISVVQPYITCFMWKRTN